MNDNDLINALKSSSSRGKAIKELYKEFPKIKANICMSGGTKQEAEEIFNDALLLLIEKVQEQNFQLTSKLSSFLYGINRFLWMNELRKKKKSVSLEWQDTMILTHERCTLVLGPRYLICNFFPCGPRTEMANSISSTLVLGPVAPAAGSDKLHKLPKRYLRHK